MRLNIRRIASRLGQRFRAARRPRREIPDARWDTTTSRRAIVAGILGAGIVTSAHAGLLGLKGRGPASTAAPPSGNLTVTGTGAGVAWSFSPAPVLLDTTMHRTVLVAQDDDFIDLHAEVALPGSPGVNSWSIGGADVDKFYSPATGKIAFRASTRAAIVPGTTLQLSAVATNATGPSAPVAINVIVVANANCRFVSFSRPDDSGNGLTPAAAWKHVPYQFEFTGTLPGTLGAGIVLFFKAEVHRTYLAEANISSGIYLRHSGAAGNNFVYCFRGWGGQASLDGSDVVTGWTSVTQGEVFNNPNWASFKKIALPGRTATGTISSGGSVTFSTDPGPLGNYQSVNAPGLPAPIFFTSVTKQWDGTSATCTVSPPPASTLTGVTITLATAFFQHTYDDDTMLFPSQLPTPPNPFNFDDPFTDAAGGMWQLPAANAGQGGGVDPGGLAAIWQAAANGDVHIRDPRIAAHYGNITVANMPPLAQIYAPGSNISLCPLLSYDYATSTIVVTNVGGSINVINQGRGYISAYSLVNHPLDIVAPGQTADFGGFRYAWLPNNGVTTISTRYRGANLNTFVTFEGMAGQRYCGSGTGFGSVFAQPFGSGSQIQQVLITGGANRQNRGQDGSGSLLQVTGSFGLLDPIVERVYFDQNVLSSGIKAGSIFDQTTMGAAPSPATVRAYPFNKIRYLHATATGCGRTFLSFNGCTTTGLHILMNTEKDVKSTHGNGISLYTTASGNVTGGISGTTLTLTVGTALVGDLLIGTGVTDPTFITADLGGGNYTVTPSQIVTAGTVMAKKRVQVSYCLIELNFFDNITRPVTTSIDPNLPRFNTYMRNVFLSYGGNATDFGSVSNGGPAFNLFSSEPGSTIKENVAMMGPGSVYVGVGISMVFSLGNGYGTIVQSNVTSGIQINAPYFPATGQTLLYDARNNLLMAQDVSLPPNTPPNQLQSGNITSAVSPTRIWDYVISAEQATTLGSGAIGPFWKIP